MLKCGNCCRKLITRWLWNADAVRRWAAKNPLPDEGEIIWWSQEREDEIRERQRRVNDEVRGVEREAELRRRARRHDKKRWNLRDANKPRADVELAEVPADNTSQEAAADAPPQPPAVGAATESESALFDGHILDFVGQGREIGYCGLAHAVVNSVYDSHEDTRQIRPVDSIVQEAILELSGHRAKSWRVMSLVSLALIWLEIGMAYMISYNTPTVGLGCRSGSYIVYGVLSSIPWALHSLSGFKHPSFRQRVLIHFFSTFALLSLLFIIFAQVCEARLRVIKADVTN